MATAASRLSSAWVRAGATAAAVVAVGLLALVLVVAVGGGNEGREAVVRYIEDVNEVVRGQAQEVDRLRFTYARLRANPEQLPELRDRLADGEAALAALAMRVRALDPPPDAENLHERLLRLLDAQASFAGEVVALAAFLPAVATQERALIGATARLRRELGEGTTEAQARAFARFASSVDVAASGITAAEAPTELLPSRDAKAERLREIAASSRRLGAALETGERRDVVVAVERFARATTASTTGVEREAALAYNRARARIARLAEAVEVERLRLQRTRL